MVLAFADQISEFQDNDLKTMVRDITNKVHCDYKKGVAYYIGYFSAAIRMSIEDVFR